jgi:lipopolysaccharide transport system ATP-binding protein
MKVTGEPVIRAAGLGKRYKVGAVHDDFPTLRDALSRGVRRLFKPSHISRATSAEFWALRNVSFEVARGEVVGIVGGNGAGKSTLLKILSRITEMTEGEALIRGRVGSLLEVGTGFHPELTGRENIFLNGVIIGMSKAAIVERFDEIVAFSGVERFIDTPVKHYSSGMYLRLAFSVAAHLDSEILLVDEVLAVGDARFQRKCMGKIGEVASGGRTVLFVSHNLTAIESLCARAFHFSEGKLVREGDPRSVILEYLGAGNRTYSERTWPDDSAPGGEDVKLQRVCVRPKDGHPSDEIDVRTPFVVEIDYVNLRPGARLSVALLVVNEHGIAVFHAGRLTPPQALQEGIYRDTCEIPGDIMNDGAYRCEIEIRNESGDAVCQCGEAIQFNILDSPDFRHGWHGQWIGAVRPMLPWSTTLVMPHAQ